MPQLHLVASISDLAEELRRIGLEGGLDAVGVCDAHPFDEARTALEQRKARGWAGGMQFTYRNPARSTDPDRTLPGAVSLVVGARRYLRQAAPGVDRRRCGSSSGSGDADHPEGPARPAGRVARYSWVDHYQPLRDALGGIADCLVEHGWRARVLVDDNALVDRAAAVRAGIGSYGKNSNVLLPGAGSWFVLGSVVTDAPLVPRGAPTATVDDQCGPCRRCLDACPTGALVGPGELDARRCLAWLVQAPGVFPFEYREALGDRLYGCDDCQEVCPVNRLGARLDPPGPAEPEAEPAADVLDLLDADDAALLAHFGRWYIPRREPRYLRRNALLVLGNTADPDDPQVGRALQRALADEDPIIQAHAVWAAARLGRPDLLEPLLDHDHDHHHDLDHDGPRRRPRDATGPPALVPAHPYPRPRAHASAPAPLDPLVAAELAAAPRVTPRRAGPTPQPGLRP